MKDILTTKLLSSVAVGERDTLGEGFSLSTNCSYRNNSVEAEGMLSVSIQLNLYLDMHVFRPNGLFCFSHPDAALLVHEGAA